MQFHFNWNHVSVIAGLTRTNCLFRLHEGSIKKEEIVEFLKALKTHLKQPLLVIWDGLKAHRNRLVREYPCTMNTPSPPLLQARPWSRAVPLPRMPRHWDRWATVGLLVLGLHAVLLALLISVRLDASPRRNGSITNGITTWAILVSPDAQAAPSSAVDEALQATSPPTEPTPPAAQALTDLSEPSAKPTPPIPATPVTPAAVPAAQAAPVAARSSEAMAGSLNAQPRAFVPALTIEHAASNEIPNNPDCQSESLVKDNAGAMTTCKKANVAFFK